MLFRPLSCCSFLILLFYMSFVPTFGFTNETDMQALLKILSGSLAHGTVLSISANGKELLAVIGIIREQVH
ncbi:hypothetical protein ACSBR2_040860 [Camellia fascicularis]